MFYMAFEILIGVQEILRVFHPAQWGEYAPGQISFLKYRSDSGAVRRSSR